MTKELREISLLMWFLAAATVFAGGGYIFWTVRNLWTPAPSIVRYQHPSLVRGFVSCIDHDCRAFAMRESVAAVRPGETLWRYVEYCLHSKRSGDVVIRYSQPSLAPRAVTWRNAAEPGCHKRFFEVPIPPVLLASEPLTISPSIEYPRETMDLQIVDLQSYTVTVRQ